MLTLQSRFDTVKIPTLPSYSPLQYGRGKSHAAVPAEVARQERVV